MINMFGIFSSKLEKSQIYAIAHGTLYHFILLLFGKRLDVWELTFEFHGAFVLALDCVSDHKTIYYYILDR